MLIMFPVKVVHFNVAFCDGLFPVKVVHLIWVSCKGDALRLFPQPVPGIRVVVWLGLQNGDPSKLPFWRFWFCAVSVVSYTKTKIKRAAVISAKHYIVMRLTAIC